MTRKLSATQVAAIEAGAPNLHNGTYTVSHPKKGHFTLKVYTQVGGDLDGKRIVKLLTGPDNTSNYTGVAFWDDAKRCAFVWKRFRGKHDGARMDGYHWSDDFSSVERKLHVFVSMAMREGVVTDYTRGCEVQRSSRCVRCNRPLTHPVSIAAGIGPECASK